MTDVERIVEVVEPSASLPVAVRVWDLPTRLFHWVLVVSVLGSFATGYIGGNAMGNAPRVGEPRELDGPLAVRPTAEQ